MQEEKNLEYIEKEMECLQKALASQTVEYCKQLVEVARFKNLNRKLAKKLKARREHYKRLLCKHLQDRRRLKTLEDWKRVEWRRLKAKINKAVAG